VNWHGMLLIVLLSFSLLLQGVHAEEWCIYENAQGVVRKVQSLRQIPQNLRGSARCSISLSANEEVLAKPQEIKISGSERKERMLTSLGPINLRWSRDIEKILGRSPFRAMADASRMVSKTLKQEGFPQEYRNVSVEWEVIFLDEELPEDQIPLHFISNCHPAWMTPPANIYVVAQRVVAGCLGSGRIPQEDIEREMTTVLAHEMGHVLESTILSAKGFQRERWRAEGFATFFERLAARYSRFVSTDFIEQRHSALARKSFQAMPDNFIFRGRAEDYARASMYLQAIVNDRSIKGLMAVYRRIDSGKQGLREAIYKETGWSEKMLEEKARKAAGF